MTKRFMLHEAIPKGFVPCWVSWDLHKEYGSKFQQVWLWMTTPTPRNWEDLYPLWKDWQ